MYVCMYVCIHSSWEHTITLSLQYIYDNIDDIDADTDGIHVNVMSRNFQVFLSVERGDLGILKAIGIQDSQVLIILSPQVKYMFNFCKVVHA